MNLVAFVSHLELLTAGLVEGEPTKGPLIKTIERHQPTRLLAITTGNNSTHELESLIGSRVKISHLAVAEASNLSALVAALKSEAHYFKEFQQAHILNAGSPQERAALWVLKQCGILAGEMIEPPADFFHTPIAWQPPRVLGHPDVKVTEPEKPFGEDSDPCNPQYWEAAAQQAGCVGRSPRFRQTLAEAATLAQHPTPILLMGETGSGKEVLARFIHALSPRAARPMVTVNCAALPETLAESILFGHEKGAFTGAYKRQKGKFEMADGGSLFLDELGELSLANQAKLLRVLETRSVDLLGGSELVKVDVRVIAATNRNLAQEVAAGRFREDLYYRLRAGEIHIPALRERLADIVPIALHLLERINATLAHPKQFSKAALKFLENQPWPGNVRDLMNTIERAVLLCNERVIEPECFKLTSHEVPRSSSKDGLPALYQGFEIETYLQKIRHQLFEKALSQANGNKSEAARLLGISPQAIHKYFKQLSEREMEDARS